jgi:hypothetical protein
MTNATTQTFCGFLESKLGTRWWFVGRMSVRTARRYNVAVSPKRFAALESEYRALQTNEGA